jgi:hypothetical protein
MVGKKLLRMREQINNLVKLMQEIRQFNNGHPTTGPPLQHLQYRISPSLGLFFNSSIVMENITKVIDTEAASAFNPDKKLSFNELPEAIAWIAKKIEEIESKLSLEVVSRAPIKQEPKWMDAKALSAYLPNHPSAQTIYGWTASRSIPFHKRGKYTIFDKREIDEWICDEYYPTDKELEAEALNYIQKEKQKKNAF